MKYRWSAQWASRQALNVFTMEEHTTSPGRPFQSFTTRIVNAECLTQFAVPGFHSLYGWYLVLESGSSYLLESLAKFNEILFLSMIGRYFMQIVGGGGLGGGCAYAQTFVCMQQCALPMAWHVTLTCHYQYHYCYLLFACHYHCLLNWYSQSDLTSNILLADWPVVVLHWLHTSQSEDWGSMYGRNL